MINFSQIRKNKKGFTLVEVIVVLVILAILAAILIPTLTGYIDKANEKVVVAEARSALMAAQTLASESYAGVSNNVDVPTTTIDADAKAAIANLAEVTGSFITAMTIDATGKVTSMTYNNGSFTATYDGTDFTTAKNK